MAPMDRVRHEILDRPSSRLWSALWRTREGIDNRRGRPLPDYDRDALQTEKAAAFLKEGDPSLVVPGSHRWEVFRTHE